MKRAFVVAGGIALAGLTTAIASQLSGQIQIDGSSTVYPITQAVAEEFSREHRNVKVTVGISGTGGGFKRFAANETAISDASRPIKAKEADAAKAAGVSFIEIPVAYDGLSIVINKSNRFIDNLTVDELKTIFLEGPKMAKTWKDVRPSWPDEEIKIYAPGTDSGTFDYFKEVVAGKTGSIRSDMSVSEDDNVLVRGVVGEKASIGFFGYAYYIENQNQLRAVPIVNPATGKAVAPTAETVESGEYAPFSRPLFIYVNKKQSYRPEVQSFVNFYLDHPELVEEVGYVKLPESMQATVRRKWQTRHEGTHFLTESGEKKKGSLTDLYR